MVKNRARKVPRKLKLYGYFTRPILPRAVLWRSQSWWWWVGQNCRARKVPHNLKLYGVHYTLYNSTSRLLTAEKSAGGGKIIGRVRRPELKIYGVPYKPYNSPRRLSAVEKFFFFLGGVPKL